LIMNRLRYQPFAGLPNILAGEFIVPEFLQDEATPDNLAQAVILCAYEWSKGQGGLATPTAEELLPPAPQQELDQMIAQFEVLLDKAGYFFPESRAPATRRTLRTLLTKPGWNHLEVRTLRGILSSLADPHPR